MHWCLQLPVNFNAADHNLFAHKQNIEVHLPTLNTAHFLYANRYWYSTARGISSLKQTQLLFSKMEGRNFFLPK
jgi:hypothetical protein